MFPPRQPLGGGHVLLRRTSWKLFPRAARRIPGVVWRWPFLDIFFYADNATHVWDVHAGYIRDFVFRKSDVFPLTPRPFLGQLVPAPRRTLAVLENNYHVDACVTREWSHVTESRRGHVFSVPCRELEGLFPFVKRTRLKDGRTDGRTERRTDGRTDGRAGARTDGQTDGRTG